MRERLADGEACEPRLLDRVTTRDEVRERFRREAARAVALPSDHARQFGRQLGEFRSTRICVGTSIASFDNHQRAPPGPHGDFAGSVAAALLSDDQRTLFVRLATPEGADREHFVFDLETGWLLYRFPATP